MRQPLESGWRLNAIPTRQQANPGRITAARITRHAATCKSDARYDANPRLS